jgi:hypothetical protein
MVQAAESFSALRALGEPDPDSRSKEFEGRRLVRVNGGYIVLNYNTYRERDYSAAERMKRYRRRLKEREDKLHRNVTSQGRHVTQAEAEAEAEAVLVSAKADPSTPPIPPKGDRAQNLIVKFEAKFIEFWNLLPKANRIGPGKTKEAWNKKIKSGFAPDAIIGGVAKLVRSDKLRKQQDPNGYQPIHATTWLNQERWNDGEEFI